ncbi:GTPase HflX [uncultured Eubacterium sp.]|jgi:GTP-binding protein HflX|uniref:GTPase HflX n=1 Tax=Eubacterium sp. TaxID=142586 RepID=UPI0025FDA3F5|nr:GTPase HflX [uncultured Eubacterium sp.]
MYENKEELEKVILVAVSTGHEEDAQESLDELEELVSTAGAVVVGRVVQNLEHINNTTYVGTGKVKEIKDLIWKTDADAIVCDDELSPAQYKNLEDELEVKVMDRTLIILDIFAGRAKTAEGKIQVELAQLRYRSTRLIGMRNLSRQGGGIGTRGPGEKKLEVDRRLIRNRISQLKEQVSEMENHRQVTRAKRQDNPVPVVAIVGYTNAGKSTLLNTVTNAEVLEEDKLFATLDPTTRNYKLPDGQEVLLTDTVGFIRKLPHHLIDAFRSTLEEAKYSDIIIHVVDASNPSMDKNVHAVYETLDNLGVKDKTIITVFNKEDKLETKPILRDFKADYVVHGAIKKGIGIDDINEAIENAVKSMRVLYENVFTYAEAGKTGLIRKYGQLLEEEYKEDGIHVKAYVPTSLIGRLN